MTWLKLSCLSLFAHSLVAQTVNKTLNVLFLGNSYTYSNNLPDLLDSLASAKGDVLNYDQNTPGGHTFNNHFNNATSISKIHSQNWDYVILQAQSQEPSFSPAQVYAQTFPFAVKLDSIVKNNFICSQTVFFETWGRKFGDQGNCANYPPVCTYSGMQDRLRSSYKLFADSVKGLMAPVGEAFRASVAANPNLNLYIPDNSHPSLEGSYLAACVFYEVLFKKSCLNNPYTNTLGLATANFLQQIAHTTVNDSLAVWNLGRFEPYAPFTYTASGGGNIQFQSISTGTNHIHQWYFGDGTTSTQINPMHTYSVNQLYTVSHVVNNGCKKDSSFQMINGVSNAIKDNGIAKAFSIYPNPAKKELHILFSGIETSAILNIYNISGELVLEQTYSPTIDVKMLNAGFYLLEIKTEDIILHQKFLVEKD
jgi:hypothetical protein